MADRIIDTLIIDPNLSSYEKFFDHDWARTTFEYVEGTPLEEPINSLFMAWRSTNGAHILPWLMAESLRGYAQGEAKGSIRYRTSYAETVLNGVTARIDKLMHYNLSLDQRRVLKRAVAKIEQDAYRSIKDAQESIQFDTAGYWNFLVNTGEFQFCILGIQRINYGSLFFAYEDFLANLIRTKEPAYSSKKKSIPMGLVGAFGDPLADFCWNHSEVDLARLVRHALAHNGGRLGADLEKYRARFVEATGVDKPLIQGEMFNLVRGNIQIAPDNTTYLFGVLKDRITKIVDVVARVGTT